MRRALVLSTAWAAATGGAVALSWLGVSSVLRDPAATGATALVPATAPRASVSPTLPPVIGTPTHRADPSPSPTGSHLTGPGTAASSGPAATASVRSYQIRGGLVAVSLGASSASLVSATANPGWSMHVYPGIEWFRVDFQQGSSDSALFVTWNGHPPMVSTYEH